MGKQAAGISDATLKLYENLIATNPAVERKGAKTPYTSRNGHMFSFLAPEGFLALRLPADAREAFLKKHKTTLCEQHGHVMKEYVVVPAALLKRTQDLQTYFELSYASIGSLKPKPTTRKKKSAADKKPAKKSAARKTPAKKNPASRKPAKAKSTAKKKKR